MRRRSVSCHFMFDVLDSLRATLAPRYDVEREIGAGGMARVYLAVEQHPHRRVAIKVLDPEVSTRLLRERFIREVDLSSNLSHPHIVPIFSAGEVDGLFYYVMPYVEGESLRHRLVRERKLPLAAALHITRDVADALAFAHAQGIIHRDIKPENILLSGDHAIVADFGIARAISAAGALTITQTGQSIGSPGYMSPEQALGSAPAAPTSTASGACCSKCWRVNRRSRASPSGSSTTGRPWNRAMRCVGWRAGSCEPSSTRALRRWHRCRMIGLPRQRNSPQRSADPPIVPVCRRGGSSRAGGGAASRWWGRPSPWPAPPPGRSCCCGARRPVSQTGALSWP